MTTNDTKLVPLTADDRAVLSQACNVLVKTADNALQAAASVLPIVVKLQTPSAQEGREADGPSTKPPATDKGELVATEPMAEEELTN